MILVIYGDLMGLNGIYPLEMTNIAVENHHVSLANRLRFFFFMVIRNSYVELPEGNG